MATAATAAAKPSAVRRKPTRREGSRFRITLVKGVPGQDGIGKDDRLSLSISPSDTGYTLRARRRTKDGLQLAVEHFAEAVHGDSFNAAKKRALELSAKACKDRGWREHKQQAIEDLL